MISANNYHQTLVYVGSQKNTIYKEILKFSEYRIQDSVINFGGPRCSHFQVKTVSWPSVIVVLNLSNAVTI